MRFLLIPWIAASVATAQPPAAAGTGRVVIEHSFPFEFVGNKVFVPVMVNGKGPYDFAIDTAAPPTVIDSDLAGELGIDVRLTGQVGGAGEGSAPLGHAGPVTLEFGGMRISAGRMAASPLVKTLAGFGGRPIYGLIGNDWVTKRVVKIDYAAKAVTVYDGDWSYEGDGTIVPATSRGFTFIRGSVTPPGMEPIPARWVLDTGAGLTGHLNTHFVDSHELLSMQFPRVVATVGFGIGGEVRHPVARMDAIALGDVTIDHPWMALSQDKAGALSLRMMDGIIGGEILSRFTLILDGPRNRVIFEKNAHFDAPLDWDMSGLTVCGGGSGGRLRVLRVVEGGPGAEAGVREGDVLVSVDGREFTERDRDAVRSLLKGEGQRRRIQMLREGAPVEVEIVLRRLVMNPAVSGPWA